jgi:hypothetical protein
MPISSWHNAFHKNLTHGTQNGLNPQQSLKAFFDSLKSYTVSWYHKILACLPCSNKEIKKINVDHRCRQNEVTRTSASSNSSPAKFVQQGVQILIPAEVRMISGCPSLETSAGVSHINYVTEGNKLPSPEGKARGACIPALLSILCESHNKNKNKSNTITFQQLLLLKLRERLDQSVMTQIQQLTSSRPLEVEDTRLFHSLTRTTTIRKKTWKGKKINRRTDRSIWTK